MAYCYSPSVGAFFNDTLTYAGGIPEDAVSVADDQFAEAVSARAAGGTLAVSAGALVITPFTGPSLAQAQTAQIAELNNAYQVALTVPVSFKTAGGTTAMFPQTAQAKSNLMQFIEAGSAAWTLNLWLDVNNSPITPFTFADLQGLAGAMEGAEVPAYQDLLTKIAAVQAATTVTDVQAITF